MNNQPEPQCPELEKIKAISDKSQIIGDFIEWLGDKKYTLAQYVSAPWLGTTTDEELIPIQISTEKLLADYFEVDLKKAEKERQSLLEFVRSQNI